MSIAKLKSNYPVKLVYTFFPLHPDTPPEGLSLQELFDCSEADINIAQKTMQEHMEKAGLEFSQRTKTYNSRLAQELAKWYESQQDDDILHHELYKTYFINNTNLADLNSLLKIIDNLNLDVEEAREVLHNRSFKEAVDKDWEKCRSLKIHAVPSYICGNRSLTGAQSYQSLENLIKDN